MARLQITAGSVALDLSIQPQGQDVLAELLQGIADGFRKDRGVWLWTQDLQGLGEVVATDGSGAFETDLVWLPAATTTVTVAFDGAPPQGIDDL